MPSRGDRSTPHPGHGVHPKGSGSHAGGHHNGGSQAGAHQNIGSKGGVHYGASGSLKPASASSLGSLKLGSGNTSPAGANANAAPTLGSLKLGGSNTPGSRLSDLHSPIKDHPRIVGLKDKLLTQTQGAMRPAANRVRPTMKLANKTSRGLTPAQATAVKQALSGPESTPFDKQIWKDYSAGRTLNTAQVRRLAQIAGRSRNPEVVNGLIAMQRHNASLASAYRLASILAGSGLGPNLVAVAPGVFGPAQAGAVLGAGAGAFGGLAGGGLGTGAVGGGLGALGGDVGGADSGVLGSMFPTGSSGVMIPMTGGKGDGPGFLVGMEPNLDEVSNTVAADPSLSVEDVIAETSSWQTTRFLQVGNATKEPLTVFLQYRTVDPNGDWSWVPAEPGSTEVLSYKLTPGQVADLHESDWRIHASRVRLWAVSDAQQFRRFQEQDLWLVPETDDEGNHGYSAPAIQTYQVAIR
jgi:hypothetical protein